MFRWLERPRCAFDGESIVGHGSRFRSASVKLCEIQEIGIETTDAGPFECDVFLVFNRGTKQVRVPSESPVFKEMFDVLGKFPGFDWMPFIESMGCTDCQYFRCWTRAETSQSANSAGS